VDKGRGCCCQKVAISIAPKGTPLIRNYMSTFDQWELVRFFARPVKSERLWLGLGQRQQCLYEPAATCLLFAKTVACGQRPFGGGGDMSLSAPSLFCDSRLEPRWT
jgi:hypothetical protein